MEGQSRSINGVAPASPVTNAVPGKIILGQTHAMKVTIPEELKRDMPQTGWGKILSATPIVMTVIATMLAGLASSEMTRAQYDRASARSFNPRPETNGVISRPRNCAAPCSATRLNSCRPPPMSIRSIIPRWKKFPPLPLPRPTATCKPRSKPFKMEKPEAEITGGLEGTG